MGTLSAMCTFTPLLLVTILSQVTGSLIIEEDGLYGMPEDMEYLSFLGMGPSVLFMPYNMPVEDDNRKFLSKRSSGLTSESINKLTRPRFGKRAAAEDRQKEVMIPWRWLGKRNTKDEGILNKEQMNCLT
eukprot:TRINITY_DN10836_c0_g1_i1.p1 TRINITY_DN10836_c0_g1~~TRINITY_DN10836_c0_g1_i1.p1  ORF type:complete len:138 (-),score=42.61 TRINITY_DN10836_c0_g1_i1:176-565(-)